MITVRDDSLEGFELWCVSDIVDARRAPDFREHLFRSLCLAFQDQRRVVTQFPQILQTLEDVLLFSTSASASAVALNFFSCFGGRLRSRVLVIEHLLNIREFAVIILDDFWR